MSAHRYTTGNSRSSLIAVQQSGSTSLNTMLPTLPVAPVSDRFRTKEILRTKDVVE